jgi:hypothetical protein
MALAISTICCSAILNVPAIRCDSLWVKIYADAAQKFAGLKVAPLPVNAPSGDAVLKCESDIFCDRKMREQQRLLVNGSDAERSCSLRTEVRDALSADNQLSGVRLQRARDNLRKSRFPRTIFADKCVDLALAQLKGDALQSLDSREAFGDAICAEEWSHVDDCAGYECEGVCLTETSHGRPWQF